MKILLAMVIMILSSSRTLGKKIITISPAGFNGYYSLGVADFIKDNYDLTDCVFSGASAGAWISVMMAHKGNHKKLMQDLDIFSDKIVDAGTFQSVLKENVLKKYMSTDFDLSKLFIGTTKLKNYRVCKEIHHNFNCLHDAVACCEASSHVPFISGNIVNKYKEEYHFDGGFCDFPFLHSENSEHIININPYVWKKENKKLNLFECISLFSKGNRNTKKMYSEGYSDTQNNKETLDKVLTPRYPEKKLIIRENDFAFWLLSS